MSPTLQTGSPGAFELRQLLWCVRQAARSGDRGRLRMEASVCFGLGHADLTVATAERVVTSLRRFDLHLKAPDAVERSYPEDMLLGAYASVRSGHGREAVELTRGLCGGDAAQGRSLRRGLTVFARLFRAGERRESSRYLRDFRDRAAQSGEGVVLSPALDAALLFAMRVWVAAHRSGRDGGRSMMCALDGHATGIRWDALDALLRHTTEGARRTVGVNCLCCAGTRTDERRLLEGLAAARDGEFRQGADLLWDWLHPASARLSVAALDCLARSIGGQMETDGRLALATPQSVLH